MYKEDFYKELLKSIDIGIYFVDNDRKITFFNDAAEKITGFSRDEVIGISCVDNLFNHMDKDGNHLCLSGCPLKSTMEDGISREADVFLHHKDGHRVPVHVSSVQIKNEKGEIVGAVETFKDIMSYYKMEKENNDLKTLAMIDGLTDIPNRRYLDEWLISKHREFIKFNRTYAVLIFDIDNFKRVNDTYGHLIGDEILKVVSNTLKGANRANDIVARYGGEEFVVVLSGVREKDINRIGSRMGSLIANSTYEVGQEDVSVSVSIGGSIVREGDDIDILLKRADSFLYESKQNGKNRINSEAGELVIGQALNTGLDVKIPSRNSSR